MSSSPFPIRTQSCGTRAHLATSLHLHAPPKSLISTSATSPAPGAGDFRVRVSWDAEQPVAVDTLHDTGPPRRAFQKAAARVQAAGSAQRRLSTSIRLGREDRAGVRRTPGSRRRHILTLGRVQTHGGSPSPADRAAGLAPRPAGKLCMGTESCRQQDFGEDRCP